MSEGFFTPGQMPIPGVATDDLIAAMVRILPNTVLRLDLVADAAAAARCAPDRNEPMANGSEHWFRTFTAADAARCADPEFAMGMVRHEFCAVVRSGASFPAAVPLQGGGSGFAISAQGHVLTNYHLVTSEVANHRRESGALNQEVRCRSLRAQVAQRDAEGAWRWEDADAVWLVSNPPTARALWEDPTGLSHPREDTALLRVDPAPERFLPISTRPVAVGEPVWMAGFPLRSARSAEARRRHGYADADGTLRVATGKVTGGETGHYGESDLDGSMGNSGSPVFASPGHVIGMFSRATGDGPRNAFEYGHLTRVHVCSKLACEGLRLAGIVSAKDG
jgi:S1-C subfamily serine protease